MTTSKPQLLPKGFLLGVACSLIGFLVLRYYGLMSHWAAAAGILIAVTVSFQLLQVIRLRRAIKERNGR